MNYEFIVDNIQITGKNVDASGNPLHVTQASFTLQHRFTGIGGENFSNEVNHTTGFNPSIAYSVLVNNKDDYGFALAEEFNWYSSLEDRYYSKIQEEELLTKPQKFVPENSSQLLQKPLRENSDLMRLERCTGQHNLEGMELRNYEMRLARKRTQDREFLRDIKSGIKNDRGDIIVKQQSGVKLDNDGGGR